MGRFDSRKGSRGARRCGVPTSGGAPCRRSTTDPTGRCPQHRNVAGVPVGGATSQFEQMSPAWLSEHDPLMVEPEWDAWEVSAAKPPEPPLPDFDAFEVETAKLAPTPTPKPDKYPTAAPPPPPGLTTGHYGHANDAVRPPDAIDVSRLDHLKGRNVVTVDLDGTIYDRENCHPAKHGAKGQFGWQDDCDHVKRDVVSDINRMCEEQDAVAVVMSWRGGATDESRRWLGHIGLRHDAVLIPGSEDDIAGLEMNWTKDGRADHAANRKQYGGGQVAFKQATVTALEKHVGAKVVGAFDDNPKVTEALAGYGVKNTVTVPNAARAQRAAAKSYTPTKSSSTSPSGLSSLGRTSSGCEWCGETFDYVNVRPAKGNGRVCGDCAASGADTPPAPTKPATSKKGGRGLARPSADDMWEGSRVVSRTGPPKGAHDLPPF